MNGTEIANGRCPICYSLVPAAAIVQLASHNGQPFFRACQACVARGMEFAARASLGFFLQPAGGPKASGDLPLGEKGADPSTPLTESPTTISASKVE